MQLEPKQVEREAARLLPEVFDELFDEEGGPLRLGEEARSARHGFDLEAEGHGRRWLFEVKQSSSPGLLASVAAERFEEAWRVDEVPVLVVPYMTPAGEKAAERLGLNWIDLAGNAHLRAEQLYIFVRGRPNRFVRRGRPSTPFAPKSTRITRLMLLAPHRWWRRKDLVAATELNSGQVSRVVKRLLTDRLLEEREGEVRPADPDALLDAWQDAYRFDRHEILRGHMSGTGIELSRGLEERLAESGRRFAFTGLPAAWAFAKFARFRLSSVYVEGDVQVVAERIGLRLNERGANVQLLAPDDSGVFAGARTVDGLTCVSPVQAYLDLKHLPERAAEAAEDLRGRGLWNGD
jgi:hypothetical protein